MSFGSGLLLLDQLLQNKKNIIYSFEGMESENYELFFMYCKTKIQKDLDPSRLEITFTLYL